ncbi:MAG: hypothetical protein JKY25_10790 [Robiginitomaculum sp.]|nr:hypothetical protein [Robiginitomaculum sp.]
MKSKLKLNFTARNEALKSMSVWFRTISLGLMAVALIEPLRNPGDFNVAATLAAGISSILTLGVSILIYTLIKEPKK